MNDLPVQTPSSTTNHHQQPIQPTTVHSGGVESGGFNIGTEVALKPVATEIDLPKEVQAAGVSHTPTTVQLPQMVQDQGVTSVGDNVPATPTNGAAVVLPLTDEQIEQASKKSLKHSIRWLAEWCVYHLKKAHRVVNGTQHSE